MAAVVLMVILRLSLGCHFLYEGVWKIKHPEFSAESFLTQAKGPAAPVFYAMVPDIDGRERLKIEKLLSAQSLVDRWRKVLDDSESRYTAPARKELAAYEEKRKKLKMELSQADEKTPAELENAEAEPAEQEVRLSEEDEQAVRQLQEKIDQLVREFRTAAEPILWEHEDKLEALLAKNEGAMLAGLESQAPVQSAPADVKAWLSAIGDVQNEYFTALKDFAKEYENIQKAVARSVAEAAPVYDDSAAVDKLVARNRLRDPKGNEVLRATRGIRAEKFFGPWNDLKRKVIRKYGLDDQQQADAEVVYRHYKEAVKSVLADNQADIAVYFQALDRFEKKVAAGNQGAAHQEQRIYDQQQKLRQEVGLWLNGLEAADKGYQDALAGLLTAEQTRKGKLPVSWTRMDLINFAVTYGLTAIGLCLMLGLFTRPAALAGGCFMLSVVLTQPAWPTIYPPDLPVVGHALLVNKDFVEMIALFTLAATAVGRWGGLDYFVENYLLHLCGRGKKRTKDEKKAKDKQDESDS
jgi:uncharacterized membrane protein YphA (DoxX/SURF4 family)